MTDSRSQALLFSRRWSCRRAAGAVRRRFNRLIFAARWQLLRREPYVTRYFGFELVYGKGNLLVRRIDDSREYEPSVAAYLQRSLPRQAQVIDVGANLGLFSLAVLGIEPSATVHMFEPSPITVGIPAICLRKVRKWPIAFWVLDQWPESLSASGVINSKTVLSIVGRLVSSIYERCDMVLTTSRGMMEQVRRCCRDHGQIRYFPTWTESVYQESAPEAAPEIPTRSGCFSVMFAGNQHEYSTNHDSV